MEIEKNWSTEVWRAPDVLPTDAILFSECGRILDHIDYRSHYFCIVKGESGIIALLVKHGSGQERMTEYMLREILPSMEILDSDNLYLLMYTVYQAHAEGRRLGIESTSTHYRQAFVEGRLKKRKLPRQNATKVWIEDGK